MNIEELKRLAEAATPGPWEYQKDGKDCPVNGYVTVRDCIYSVCVLPYEGIRADDRVTDNGLFIAAANPAAVLELIAEVESLRAEVKTEQALSFRDQVAGLEKQRDKLLAASKKMIEWFGSSSLGDAPITAMRRAIANAERQP